MLPESPQTSMWVAIPATCRFIGEFTGDRNLCLQVGNEDLVMEFEPAALERFVKLANDMLAMPIPADRRTDMPTLVA